jgi:putative methanogenesis marker protein 7
LITYEYYLFKGGVYRKEKLDDFLEDVGGLVVQEYRVLNESIVSLAIPTEEEARLDEIAKELKANLTKTPLIGTEIAVLTPSMSRKHLPHPVCDVAEHLRRYGGKTNVIGLSRGAGQKGGLSPREKRLIEEHDVAVVMLGNFRYCLQECKTSLYEELGIPSVIVGGPTQIEVPSPHLYVGGLGRINHRLRRGEEIKKLDEIRRAVNFLIRKVREEQLHDPLIIDPLLAMICVKEQIPEVLEQPSPGPLTLKLDGLRIKLPYDKCVERVRKVNLNGDLTLEEVAEIKKTFFSDYILVKVLPESEVSLPEKCIRNYKGFS